MEMKTVHYYIAVAEELNLTRAAERLMMSQPPLSYQMKKLEEELGVTLFLRGKRRLELTDAGKLFLRRAYELEALEEKSREEMQSFGKGISGNLSIGLVEGRAPYLAAHWMKNYRQEHPGVTFEFWNGSGDDVLDRLHHGRADLALIAAPYNTELLEGFPVAHEPWAAFMSISHPLAQKSGDFLPLKELAGQPLFIPSRRSRIEGVRAWFREIGEEPLIAGELSSHIDAVALAEQNVGICIYPMTTYNDSNLVAKKVIVESERQIEYVLVWNRNQQQKELAQEFVNFVQDCLEEEQKGTVSYIIPDKEYFPPEGTPLL